MRFMMMLLAATVSACAVTPRVAATAEPAGSPYVLVFAGDKDEKDEDFFAVLDVDLAVRPSAGRLRRCPSA
jgi:hypothetical protein